MALYKYSSFPFYADDTQIYGVYVVWQALHGFSSRCPRAKTKRRCGRGPIDRSFNTAKTGIIRCSSSRRRDQIPPTALRAGNDSVMPASSMRDQGIYTATSGRHYSAMITDRPKLTTKIALWM